MSNKSGEADDKVPLCFVVGPIGKDGSVERKHSDLLLNVDEAKQSITMETRDRALARIRTRLARYIPEGVMLSEELLADRRKEAARE